MSQEIEEKTTINQTSKRITILDDMYNYFKENMITSSLSIINFFGITYFLIYFIKINYIPNLDFSGTVYLLIVMSFIGLFVSIFLYFVLILPSIIWQEGVSFSFNDKIIKDKFLNNLNFIIMISLSSISIYIITVYINNGLYQTLSFFFLLWFYSSVTQYLINSFSFKSYMSIGNLLQILKIFILYFVLSIIILFPIIVIYLVSGTQQLNSEFPTFVLIAIVINLLFLQNKSLLILFSIFIFFLGLFFINPGLIPTLVIQKLHIGGFSATVIFKHDYCLTLRTYQIPITQENKASCSVNINKVLWRVGKESLLNVADKNITVPSDQIISMSWPMTTSKPKTLIDHNSTALSTISFEFNSTNLTNNGKQELIKQINVLDKNTTKEITVYGCSSPEGTKSFNKTLSEQRAKFVQSFINDYLAQGKNTIIVNIVAEGTSNHCTDEKLIKELANHRKVIIK